MKSRGYNSWWIKRRGSWRIQIYYPAFIMERQDIMVRLAFCLRFTWTKEYKGAALSLGIIGIGYDYSPS